MEKIREHIIFYGHVQGVGFRYRAMYLARSLQLTGWVRNEWDGTVEMEVQGTLQDIQQLLVKLREQRFIFISDVREKRIPVEPENSFHVR